MSALRQCEFFLLRYAANPFTEDAVNIGLVLREISPDQNNPNQLSAFQDIRFARKGSQLLRTIADPAYLDALKADLTEKFSSGGEALSQLVKSMTDGWSNHIRVSDPRPLLTESPAQEIENLAAVYLASPASANSTSMGSRQRVRRQMQRAFEDAGVWKLLRNEIAVADYTQDGDPLKIDCGYRPNGVIRMFHAVSLESGREAKALAFSYPTLAAAMGKAEQAKTQLTAIVADEIDRTGTTIAFSMRVLENSRIEIATAKNLPGIAQRAAEELRAGS